MYKYVIAIDLETTGLDPANDEILEIGAVVINNNNIDETFSELIATQNVPGLVVQKLTGIKPDMLKSARPIAEVIPDFLNFLEREDTLYIAHNANFDRSFLQTASRDLFKHKMLDTVGLSRILLPMLQSHALEFLAEALHLPETSSHRALKDAQTTAHLWLTLLTRAKQLAPAILQQFNLLLAKHKRHPFHDFFQRLEDRPGLSEKTSDLRSLFHKHKILGKKLPERELPEEHGKLELQQIEEIFQTQGRLSTSIKKFEHRYGQMQMAVEVGDALNHDQHLVVEAPTGIGKSMAYLIPVLLFSKQEGFPVIISTNTKNLQTQLFNKDIPLVQEALQIEFKSAIIKGRGNYLCLRKLFYILDSMERELNQEERVLLLTLLNWASQSKSGDITECVLAGRPNFSELWGKLGSIGDECMGRSCQNFSRCFLRQARALSMSADLVVANHALVFAEMNMESSVLPEYQHLVFDEAHNLEAAATEHLTIEASYFRFNQVLSRMHRVRRRGKKKETGLLPNIVHQLNLSNCRTQTELIEQCAVNCQTMSQIIVEAKPLISVFFGDLYSTLGKTAGISQLRYDQGRKNPKAWKKIEASKTALISALAQIMHKAERTVEIMREMPSGCIAYLRDFQRELEAVTVWLRELISDLEFVLAGSETNYVYWISRTSLRQGGALAKAAPLRIAELLHDQVYSQKKSCVFCSATLTVRDKFDFLAGRLGLNLIPENKFKQLQVPTPFDYKTQCLLLIPSFLSDPGQNQSEEYVTELAQLLTRVYRLTRGRGLALFTSYNMLHKCLEQLQLSMQGDAIQLLAQGVSGSREHITSVFKRNINSVLLGTHSFWEGVDVVGETLSCLTIAKLPFAVFTDPVNQARCEQLEEEGKDAFMHYSLPSAVIRLKQGFGRLIRSKQDRGIVIIADRRIVIKRYGKIFLDSLATEALNINNSQKFLKLVEDFFAEDL